MFSASVVSNRNGSCGTITTRLASEASAIEARGRPPSRIWPDRGSIRRVSSLANVLLPEPVSPTTATCSPGSMLTVMSRSTVGPAPYAAATPTSSMPTGPAANQSASAPSTTADGVTTSSRVRRQPARAFCASPNDCTRNCSGRTKKVTRNSIATSRPAVSSGAGPHPGGSTTRRRA